MKTEKSQKIFSNSYSLLNIVYLSSLIVLLLILIVKIANDTGIIDLPIFKKEQVTTKQLTRAESTHDNSHINSDSELPKLLKEPTKTDQQTSTINSTTPVVVHPEPANNTLLTKMLSPLTRIKNNFSNWIYEYGIRPYAINALADLEHKESTYSFILHDTKIVDQRCYLQFQIIEMPLIHHKLSYKDFTIASYAKHINGGLQKAFRSNERKAARAGITINGVSFPPAISALQVYYNYSQKADYLTKKIKGIDEINEPVKIPEKKITNGFQLKQTNMNTI